MTTNQSWWPNQLSLKALRQNSPASDPMGGDFNYALAFKNVDVGELKKDVEQVMTTSKTGGRPKTGGRRTTATMGRSSSA